MPIDLILPTYFVVWWITLFAVLPVGIKHPTAEERAVEHYAGAPLNPNLKKKVLWNFPLAAVVTAVIYLSLS